MLLSAGCNCGDPPVVSGGGESTGTMAETTGQSGTADSTTTWGTTSGTESTTSGSSSGPSSTTETEPPPYPEACHEPEALIAVAQAQIPDGPLTVDEAWLGVDFCSEAPYVTLAQLPAAGVPGQDVRILLSTEGPSQDLFHGTYEAIVEWNARGTFEVLEPVGPFEPTVPNADNYLHALIEVHEGGYDLSLEVGLLDCGAADCFCPCE